MFRVWNPSRDLIKNYDKWHRETTHKCSVAIRQQIVDGRQPMSVAAKLLDTFMHQLMKYEPCRPLWNALHLPLDRRVFSALIRLRSPSLAGVRQYFDLSPYDLKYSAHMEIQSRLWGLVKELNSRPSAEFCIGSRIELNWLWI
jgi:hypothetical protein